MLWQMKNSITTCVTCAPHLCKSSATHSDLYQYSCIPHAICCTSVHCSIVLSSQVYGYFFKIHISKQLDRNLCPINKPKATVSFQASKLSTCLYIWHRALSCNINFSTQQTTKPHMNAAVLTPSVSVTSTLPSASSSMSLWMLRMASKLSREFSSWQSSSSIPHSSEETKQYMKYATETPLKLHNFSVTKQAAYKGIFLRNLATYPCNVLFY